MLSFLLASLLQLPAQDNPKREFRGVWVASVFNIDYPSRPTTDRIALREEWRQLLDKYREMGMNAVIVQVRAAGDALYPSRLAPWSRFLTGQQGRAPESEFDPLEFMIEETHCRGMEFHAWLNPYRATVNLDTSGLSPQHAFHQHRSWMLRYGPRFYFNPALPEVREHLVKVVEEVVANYDVDAIHFDDYFYPYQLQGEVFPDSLDFQRMGAAFEFIENWRRSNVDSLISQMADMIRQTRPGVALGISPFGVWRNKVDDPLGSETRAGSTSYDHLYADVLKWLREGWIDYVMPQLYWNIGYPAADFERLLDWWGRHSYGKNLYIGHAAYKVGNHPELAWSEPDEIPRQIQLIRRHPRCGGSAFFSSQSLRKNFLGLKDSLERLFRHPALIPVAEDAVGSAPSHPLTGRTGHRDEGVLLRWRIKPPKEQAAPYYYVVYRFEGMNAGDIRHPDNILAVTPFHRDQGRYFKWIDPTAERGKIYTYAVSAVDRSHRESAATEFRSLLVRESGGINRLSEREKEKLRAAAEEED